MDLARLLDGVVAPGELVLDPGELDVVSSDVWTRGERCAGLLRVRDVERLARTVAALTRAGVPVVPRGGGMSYTGGYLGGAGSVVVDASVLDRIVELAPEDHYVVVEAGVTWKQLNAALAPHGLRTPFFGTFSGARATVGGGLSNGALFFGSARHGTAADCTLGLEVIRGPVHTHFGAATEADFVQRKARRSKISGISE
jgi:FAD/FMN-containing dehydrogenase